MSKVVRLHCIRCEMDFIVSLEEYIAAMGLRCISCQDAEKDGKDD